MHKLLPADGPATTLSQSAATVGRKLMGRWVYPLSGIVSIPASTWTVTYRAMRSASATSVVAHCDINILIRKSDNTIRTTIATNVANSPTITLVNAWQTLTGTYNWAAYTVVDQTDYLEVAYYIEVTTPQSSKSVRLLVDDSTLPLADQTKIQNVMFTYPNQAPVASFTYSPTDPVINEVVTFNASASYDPDGNIVSYEWDFGDGNITTVTNPIITHVYTTAQSTVNYTVTLTVTDNEGSTGSTTQSVPVTNPSILHVSLPAGTYVGPDPDHWLSQCWLLSITGLSGTFTIRINNTHASWASYDTHLIIALNNASYEYLDSLAVDATTIPKTSFIYGTPEPYGFTLTWEEDVYPTWFSDVYVVGTVDPKSYKDVQVSVTFSNTTGVRMHFDAYGSTCSPPPPTGKGRVTHNPHEKDSTVLFYPPIVKLPPHADFTWEPPSPQVCETVTFNASASYDPDGYIVNYTWNFGDGNITWVTDRIITHHYTTNGTYTVNLTVTDNDGLTNSTVKTVTVRKHPVADFTWSPDSPGVGETVTFDGSLSTPDGGTIVSYEWDFGDGSPHKFGKIVTYAYNNNGTYPVTLNVTDSEGKWDTESKPIAVKVKKYYLTVISPYGTTGGQGWYDNCTTAYATLNTSIIDHLNGTRRIFTHWSGDASGTNYSKSDPIHMDGNKTAIANWKTQYLVTFAQTGLDSTATGTVVTVNGTPITFPELPFPMWVNESSWVSYSYSDIVLSTVSGKRFKLVSVTSPPSPFHVTGPVTVTGNYKTQYQVTFDQTGVGSDFTGTVVVIDATNYRVVNLSVSFWWDNCSIHNFDFKSPLLVSPDAKQYIWASTSGLSSLQSGSIHVSTFGSIIGNYKTQYYLTVISPYDTPGGMGWYNESTNAYATLATSIENHGNGTRRVFINWTGDATGTALTSDPIHMDKPKTAIANWKTQYLLAVDTNPSGLSPQPTRNPPGEAGSNWWYDKSTNVVLEANLTAYLNDDKYVFLNWNVDGINVTGNPINVHMNPPHTAIAYYKVYEAPRKCAVDFTEDPKSPIKLGTTVTFTVNVIQKASNGTHEVDCTLYEWNITAPNGTSYILRYGKQWNNFSNTMQWTFNVYDTWTVTLRAFCNDTTLISLGLAWSDPVSDTKYVPRPVGGYVTPVCKLNLLAPWTGSILGLLAAVAATIALFKLRSRKH